MQIKKTLIIAGMQSWPPNVGGAPTVMYDLFKDLDHTKFDVLTSYRLNAKKDNKSLNNKIYYFPSSKCNKYRFIWRFSFIEDIIRYIYYGLKLISTSNSYVKIFITFPDTGALIGGFILSKLFYLKFDIYLLDLLSETRTLKIEKIILKLFEKTILTKANTVFCLEGLSKYYLNLVDRNYVVLNRCVADNYVKQRSDYQINTITYAGQIYDLSLDALQNLVRAISLKPEKNISLKIYSNISHEKLKEYQLDSEFVQLCFAYNYDEFITELSQSEILFSPVAFNTPYPNQAKTCFPTKTFDYIKAGRPILLNAPKQYFYTQYMLKYKCAYISTSNDPSRLLDDIHKLLGNRSLQETIVNNAEKLLEKRHLRSQVQNLFLNTISN